MKTYYVFLFLFCVISVRAQLNSNRTYYYERVAIVKNGEKQDASGDGHYLTLNSRILYESDANGSSKGTSSVKYINSNNNMPLYEGNTVLGRELSYVFNSDYSRLNVRKMNGTVYVYERKSQPTASKMRIYEKNEEGTYIASTTEAEQSGQPSKSRTSSSPSPKKQKVTCTRCNGTKYIDKYVPIVSEHGVKKPEYYICNICNKRVAKNGGHGHATCPSCHGTGYVFK